MTKYQVVSVGSKHKLLNDVTETLFKRVLDLGLHKDSIILIDRGNFSKEYKANAPCFCLYFGDESGNFEDLDILNVLLRDANLILPIVTDLTQFRTQIPSTLAN